MRRPTAYGRYETERKQHPETGVDDELNKVADDARDC
jgi:hypothetical protein